MTTNTISPTLTLAALPVGAATAIAPVLPTSPSGEIPIPADFALALAGLVTAPPEIAARPNLAIPGKALPLVAGEIAIAMPDTATTDDAALALPLPNGDEIARGSISDEPASAEDDVRLDPALNWLIVPPLPVSVPPAPADPAAQMVSEAPSPGPLANTPPVSAPPVEANAPVPVPGETPAPSIQPNVTPQSPAVAVDEAPVAPAGAAEPQIATRKPAEIADRPAQAPNPELVRIIAEAPVVAVARPLAEVPARFAVPGGAPTTAVLPDASSAEAAPTPIPSASPNAPMTAVAAPPPPPPATAPLQTVENVVIAEVAVIEKPVARGRENAPAALVAAPASSATPVTSPSIATIGATLARPLPRAVELRPTSDSAASLFAAALTHASTAPTAVQPTVDARSPAMDLTRDTGLERMIDRIEMLRDDADTRDTRIRLVPDALGPVEVSVRRDGDAIRIHFTADQPATRTLIADAQPRLTELAEARGIRISQASVDTGTASDGRARPQQPASQTPSAPRRVNTETSASADERIA